MGIVLVIAACQPAPTPAPRAVEQKGDPSEQKAKLERLERAAMAAGQEAQRLEKEYSQLIVANAEAAATAADAAVASADAATGGAAPAAMAEAQAASDEASKRSDEVSAKTDEVERMLSNARARARVSYEEYERELAKGAGATQASSSDRWKEVYQGQGFVFHIDQRSIVRDATKQEVTFWGRSTFGEPQGPDRVVKTVFNQRINCGRRTSADGGQIRYDESGAQVGKTDKPTFGAEIPVAPESPDEALLEALCPGPKQP